MRPWDLNAATWLGMHLAKSGSYKEAVDHFLLASQLQPKEIKWLLMAALCLRKSGQGAAALALYEKMHRDRPDDQDVIDGLRRTRAALGIQSD